MTVDNRYRLRQLALVTEKLAPVEAALTQIFGLQVAHRDPGVEKFGLENIVVPVGNQFIEVVAPTRDDTTAGRYLDRRGGDGGYMVILQCTDPAGRDDRADALGIRTVYSIDRDDYDGLQLHPRDTGGTFLEIDCTDGFNQPDGPWYPAGDGWQRAQQTDVVTGIASATIQSNDPEALARRWAAILDHDIEKTKTSFAIQLEQGALRFDAAADGRGEGLSEIDMMVKDRAYIDSAAADHGLSIIENQLTLGGVRFNLLSA
ncbi:MAG: VOC family protein [Alphaproteobacteria bacterium]